MIKLVCKAVRYMSTIDEDFFFAWIDRISCIEKVEGVGSELHLYIQEHNISRSNLKEILTLFLRYRIDTEQLKIFVKDENKDWFYNELLFQHALKSKVTIEFTGLLQKPK